MFNYRFSQAPGSGPAKSKAQVQQMTVGVCDMLLAEVSCPDWVLRCQGSPDRLVHLTRSVEVDAWFRQPEQVAAVALQPHLGARQPFGL